MKREISIPEWHRMALEGVSLPVCIQLNGYSMDPLIRGYRDYVTVIPLEDSMQIGDIVMFCEPNTERYVMHRVWDQKNGMVLTWGDNCKNPDGWLPVETIWGKVSLIERGKRKIQPNPQRGMRWAKFWHHAGKVYRLYQRYKNGVLRRIRRQKV